MISVVGARSSAAPRGLLALVTPSAVAFLAAAASVVGVSASAGGYYPQAWGWATLAYLVFAFALLLVLRRLDLALGPWLLFGAFALFTLWVGVSALRPGAATLAVPEVERTGFYLAVVWAAVVGFPYVSVSADALAAGVFAGIVAVCCWGLGVFLFLADGAPDLYEGRLLFQPLGYSNGMGAVAAMGVVLALGISCHAGWVGARVAASAALVPLSATLWFTGSRGATAALVVGVAAMVALDPARRRLLATAAVTWPLALLGVWLGRGSQVGNAQADPGVVAHSGHVVAAALALLTGASAVIAFWLLRRERLGRSVWVGVALLVIAACAAVAAGTRTLPADIFSDRSDYWRAAVADYRAHPLLGSGAGSFEVAWLRYRTSPVSVRDAHNLYLETLAELGPLGLALLAAALLVPLCFLFLRPRRPAVTIAFGAYAVFLAHAALDWDWELPAVTVVGLLIAITLMTGSRPEESAHPARPSATIIAAAVTLACALPVSAEIIGNRALAAAQGAAASQRWTAAADQARVASQWQPWSAEPVYLLGLAQLASGDTAAAHASFARATRLNPRDWRAWYQLGSTSPQPRTRQQALDQIAQLNPISLRDQTG